MSKTVAPAGTMPPKGTPNVIERSPAIWPLPKTPPPSGRLTIIHRTPNPNPSTEGVFSDSDMAAEWDRRPGQRGWRPKWPLRGRPSKIGRV